MSRVLVLMADGPRRSEVCRILEEGGHAVLAAEASGSEEAVTAWSPQLVVVDETCTGDGPGGLGALRSLLAGRTVLDLGGGPGDLSLLLQLSAGPEPVAREPPRETAPEEDHAVAATGAGAAHEPPSSDRFAVEMAALRADFLAVLPDRLEELANALRSIGTDPAGPEVAASLAHRLRGTAGSFGHHEVSIAAAKIEELLAPPPKSLRRASTPAAPVEGMAGSRTDERPEQVGSQGHPSEAILVVDDDVEFLSTIREFARRAGTRVVTAPTAIQALEIARTQPLSGALLDVYLGDGMKRPPRLK